MGLGIYVQDRGLNEIRHATDDVENSFRSVCESAPRESLRRGVMRYGRTTFNVAQMHRLIEELEALPPAERSPVVDQVIDIAWVAVRSSGYLLFVGD